MQIKTILRNRTIRIETDFDRVLRYYRNECSEIEHPLRDRAIKKQEYLQLIKQYWDLNTYRLIWELLWTCGMRPIEVCWLQVQNFNEDFTLLGYKQAKYRKIIKNGIIIKRHKPRVIPIPHKLAQKLRDYIDMNKLILHNGFLFPTFDRERMKKGLFYLNPRTLNFEMDKLRSILKGRFLETTSYGHHLIAPHSFRRSWIARYQDKYKNPYPSTTFKYYQENDLNDINVFINQTYLNVHIPHLTKDQLTLQNFQNV